MDKRSRILSVLALCVAIACVATALITVVVMLFRHGRQREQVTAVDGNVLSNLYLCFLFNFGSMIQKWVNMFMSYIADVSSAISVTDSGLSQYSL
jgi:hypothetical protein